MHVTQEATLAAPDCIFCAICAGEEQARTVYEDDVVVVFMALNAINPGHVLVVPRKHAVGLEDLDGAAGTRVWSVAQDMARALRRSSLNCQGINLMVCDGTAAFQSVFHFHLHIIPRHSGDAWVMDGTEVPTRERSLLEADAQAIRDCLAKTSPRVL